MMDVSRERGLIERLRAGDDSAVGDLRQAYGPRIYQLALRHLRNHEDAEEVTQDVLLRVFKKIAAFRGDAALSSWIYRITFNTAMSRLRSARVSRSFERVQDETRARTETVAEGGLARRDVADWSSLADDEVLRGELRRRLVKALQGLPDLYRVPVLLRDVQGLSTEEASAILRLKPETLKSRLHRGRLILRDLLSDFAGGLSLRRVV